MSDEDLLEKAFAEEETPRLASGNRVVPPQLLSKLRHDMRTPIHQILGYAEMVEEDAIATGQTGCAADLGKIQDAARRLLEMVDTLQERLLPAADEAAPPAPLHDEPQAAGFDPSPGLLHDVPPVTGPIRRADLEAPVGAPVEPAHLLVVDDNAENRDMLSRRLRAHG